MPEIPTVTVSGVPDPIPDDVTVLDVREPVEWQHGHIDGAVHIPLMELGARLQEVPVGGRWWCARWVAGPHRPWPT
jgi:rhodanese-related sulfurtransferase